MPQQIDAVIFDFDETMIDLERQHTAPHARLCASMGCSYDDMPEEFRRGSGRRIVDDIREMRAFFGWTPPGDELFAERQRYFDEEIANSDLQLMPGVERTVRALHARGLVLAVTSSAVRGAIETILRRFGLLPMFAVVVDGSEVANGKPDPEAYLSTARALAVDPAQCVVFEDSTVGVQAAKAAGMFCIAVRNPNAFYRQDLDAADVVVSSFDEVDPVWFYPSARTTSRRS